MTRRFPLFQFLVISVLLLSACGPSPEAQETMTAAAWTPTPQPTDTPLPSSTPTITPTATPSPTPTPPPDPWGDVLIDPGQPVQVAFLGDLSGPTSAQATLLLDAARFAVEDYGALQGFPVEILPFDDQCDPNAAVIAKDQVLANRQILGVVGVGCPQAATQELPYFETAHLAILASGATQVGLEAYAPGVWNSTALDDAQSAELAGFFKITDQPSYQAFSARFEARYGSALGDSGALAAATYDAVQILLKAIEKSLWISSEGSLVIGRQVILNQVRSTRAYDGASGFISLDEAGRRLPPVAPDLWGDVIVKPGEKIRLAALDPSIDPFRGVLPLASAMALQDFGPLRGFEVELVEFDDACNEPGGVSPAPDVVMQGNIAGVLGPFCSMAASTGLPQLEAAHIVAVSPSATRPDLNDFGRDIFNRVVLNGQQLAAAGYPDENYVQTLDTVQSFYARLAQWAGLDMNAKDGWWVYYAYSYDAANVLLSAIDQVARIAPDGSLVIGRKALAEAVRATESFPGVTGIISLDSRGNRQP